MSVWFVLYCKPNKDAAVERNLLIRGFDVYRPIVKKAKSGQGGAKSFYEESLFPRYLFLKINPDETSVTPVNYTPGVIGFVRFGDKYSTVDETVILKIKDYELAQLSSENDNCDFKKGELVYINGDGFSDILATFCESRSDNRVIVLLNMLGTMSATSVPKSYISKTSNY
ncbi:transcription termination/antitermination NusG family protein [Aliikangiella sp. IMCC44359]|uniref:transcription termination/antitermination NusG family protein n=1 Tax=Aliikangiella sp. IMCC44359 TaxID=3459125 RepID=UPI00403A871F